MDTKAGQAQFYCRTGGVKVNSIENEIKKYVRITLAKVEAKYSQEYLPKHISVGTEFYTSQLADTKDNFDALEIKSTYPEWNP